MAYENFVSHSCFKNISLSKYYKYLGFYPDALSVCWQKRLFGFCLKGCLVRLGQKPMCRLRVGIKLNLKKCAVGKIKNTEGQAMSVGLLVVRLKYGLYVGHLSKWFVCVN